MVKYCIKLLILIEIKKIQKKKNRPQPTKTYLTRGFKPIMFLSRFKGVFERISMTYSPCRWLIGALSLETRFKDVLESTSSNVSYIPKLGGLILLSGSLVTILILFLALE